MRGRSRKAQRRTVALGIAFCAAIAARPAAAEPFQIGEVTGLLDLSVGWGMQFRVEDVDRDFVGLGNGGRAPTVDGDDGTLNYDRGIVANQIRGTGELTVRWRNLGLFVRGYGFYDFENRLGDREHRALSSNAKWLVGGGAELQDAFVTGRFSVAEVPVVVRVGNQVINWGESSFLRFGVDIVNPVDFVAVLQPTTTARDLFVRQGMVWSAVNLTESVAVEGYYQYDWQPAVLAPTGSFFSANDVIGGDGIRAAFEGFGRFSDLGTDKTETFGLPNDPPPPLGGFDRDFMKIPEAGRREPRDQGQFGFAVTAFLPILNASKLSAHFSSYHSRLPVVSGRTASAGVVSTSDDAGVAARAAALSGATGLPASETTPIAEDYTISDVANDTRVFATYPEDIRMFGVSFSTATPRSGTLISGEISHHFGWPVQQPLEDVIGASLSPIGFSNDATSAFRSTPLGVFQADETVKGFFRSGKTQASLGIAQLLGPRLYASQTLLTLDVGWVRIDDLPDDFLFDTNSAGYRLGASLQYDGVFGAFQVSPGVFFTHDFAGITPEPGGAFLEGRKSVTALVTVRFATTISARIDYTNFFGGKGLDPGVDRDFASFNVIFSY